MAVANLDTNKVTAKWNDIIALTPTALDGTDGGAYTVTARDERIMIIIQNTDDTNAENVVIKAPAHPQMGAGTGLADKTVSVAKSTTAVALIEAVRYADAVTGKITIKGSADVKVSVVQF